MGLQKPKVDLKGWKRWTEYTKEFPKNKYHFSDYLKRRGDYIQTFPLSNQDKNRIFWAAKHWAFVKKKRIKTEFMPVGDDWVVRITLVELHRKRDLPTL